jgi:hypothetical protein
MTVSYASGFIGANETAMHQGSLQVQSAGQAPVCCASCIHLQQTCMSMQLKMRCMSSYADCRGVDLYVVAVAC